MKKLLLGAAALLVTGAMLAQVNTVNAGTLTDVKGNSAVDADWVAPLGPLVIPGGNTGESIQNGNTNKVMVRQAGANNSVKTNQSDGLGTGDNKARIWQTGMVAPPPSGFANFSDVRQIGTNNQSDIGQEGDLNEAITKQGMKTALGLSTDNKSYINHGIGEQGEDNYAMVEQDGNRNSAKTVQVFDSNQARTVQEGDDNISDIRQNGGGNGSVGHVALAEQYGNSNTTKIRQWGSNENSARSIQDGNHNKSNQFQTSNGGSGVGNKAVVSQGVAGITVPGTPSNDLVNDLLTIDDVNNTGFNGPSNDGLALQVQMGTNNDAFLGQYGTGSSVGNYGEQNQVGDSNAAVMIQNFSGSASGGDNYGRQDQGGDDNEAGLWQNGSDHLAYQRQLGDDNIALSTQRGHDNHLSTYQGGDGNVLETAQRGQNNTILLVQKEQGYGGHSYKVTQNLPNGSPVGVPNGGNIVDVLQLGPNGDFVNDAEGCDFQPQVELDCPDPLMSFDIANPCGPGGC